MYCLIWRDSVMVLLVCYGRYNPLHYVYARRRQVGTSGWHVRVMVGAPATGAAGVVLCRWPQGEDGIARWDVPAAAIVAGAFPLQ